jgi:hypothetical protein
MLNRHTGVLAALVAAWLAVGCSTTWIRSETRVKQGQAAQQAWAEVDLEQQVAVPRKNLQTLLDEQLKLEDELWATRRERLAYAMAYSWTQQEFRDRVSAGLTRVFGSTQLTPLTVARQNLQDAVDVQTNRERVLLAQGIPRPSCELISQAQTDPEKKLRLDEFITNVGDENGIIVLREFVRGSIANCATIVSGTSGVALGGELGIARGLLDADLTALQADQTRALPVRAAYETAVKEYEAAAAKLSPDKDKDGTAVAEVQAAMAKLTALFEQLKDASDVFSVELLSQAKLASVERFLSTYSDVRLGKASPENASKAAIALALFPELQAKAEAALKTAKAPNLVPLVMEKTVHQARLAAAQRDIATRNSVIAHRRVQLDLLMEQLDAYRRADVALNEALKAANVTDKTLLGALQPLAVAKEQDLAGQSPFESKQKLWKASALYLDAEGRLRAEVAKTRYRITALAHERALTYSEASIHQWKALVDPAVGLMVMYSESGFASSDVEAFANALTLLWIAIGVNR